MFNYIGIDVSKATLQVYIPIKEMLTYYKFLQKQRVSFSNHLEALSSKDGSSYIIKELKKEIKQLKSQENRMITKMKSVTLSDNTMLQKFENITSIVGIGDRSMLFMPVLSAIQHNPYMQLFYDRLKANGKHSTSAQIAVMRKMILIAHSLFKNDIKFDNELYEKNLGWEEKDINKVA